MPDPLEGFSSLFRDFIIPRGSLIPAALANEVPRRPSTRSTVAVVEPTEEIAELADKASSLLGYGRLQRATKSKLARVLKELDIEIFNTEEVETYKQQTTLVHRGQVYGNSNAWSRTAISKYDKPIPEFVLNKAVQLKENLPNVEIYVDELQSTVISDPFLYVFFGNEGYYIEVWDEPKFEGRISK